MRPLLATLVLSILLTAVCYAEDADAIREQGIAALKDSQSNPRAIVEAARAFVKASDLYVAAGNEEKAIEMNSFLYWCKKKMTLEDIEAFTKAGEAAVSNKLADLEKAAPKADDAQKWFDRADQFATAKPDEHLLIAIRFFEVADRFQGTSASLKAQDRSLKELVQDKSGSKPATLKPAAPEPDIKAPLPTAAQQKDADKMIRDIFKDDFAKSAPADRLALIAKLMKQADESKDDPTSRYALLAHAVTLAAQAGDLDQLSAAADKISESFESDKNALLKTALGTLISVTKDPLLSKFAIAVRTLLEKPEDPSANLVAGRYLAFKKSNFNAALPFLAKSSHPTLSKLAKEDTASPEQSAAQVALADEWWDAAEKADKEEKPGYRMRAIFWYSQALPKLTGLSKMKIEKRIAESGEKISSPKTQAEAATTARDRKIPPIRTTTSTSYTTAATHSRPWISKNATYTVAQPADEWPPKPTLLNGESPEYKPQGGDGFSFISRDPEEPSITVDLGRSFIISEIEIVNRWHIDTERTKTMTVSVQNAPTDPWTELWHVPEMANRWNIEFGTPLVARYIKFAIHEKNEFHLASIRVFGDVASNQAAVPAPPPIAKPQKETNTAPPPAQGKGSVFDFKVYGIVAQSKNYVPGLLLTEYPKQADQNAPTTYYNGKMLGQPAKFLRSLKDSTVKYTHDTNIIAGGYLKIDVDGEYKFCPEANYDRYSFYVNGEELCKFGNYRKTMSIQLQKGLVPIALGGYLEGNVCIKWIPPGKTQLELIPGNLYFHNPEQGEK